jgi:cyclase
MIRTTLASLALVCLTAPALAQNAQIAPGGPPVGLDFSKVEVKTTDLGNRTWMLSNGISGNVTVAAGDDGIIMVDAQHAPMHDRLKAAIAALSPQPIKYIVNTHHHTDHTGGDAGFAAEGTTVVAHANVKKFLAAGTMSNITGQKVPAVPPEGLPKQTYDAATGPVLHVKGRTAVLKHPANAHTGGDTYVWFADANVLSTGDTFTYNRYPNIDWINGGSLKGVLAAVDAYLKLTNDQTKIVPGHGPLASKAQLVEYRTMLMTARERMAKLVKDGKSEDDVIAAKPYADLDGKWAPNEQVAKNFMRVMYNTVKGG